MSAKFWSYISVLDSTGGLPVKTYGSCILCLGSVLVLFSTYSLSCVVSRGPDSIRQSECFEGGWKWRKAQSQRKPQCRISDQSCWFTQGSIIMTVFILHLCLVCLMLRVAWSIYNAHLCTESEIRMCPVRLCVYAWEWPWPVLSHVMKLLGGVRGGS